ncbi:MAG: hypothetical protein F6K08_07580 [Okeania sp. SIO1H6]|nr:hypothetical protein [Okeania sp. SIO2G5]NET12719.1 hypothetical protein [Okeania sp. SIO1H6]
MLESTSNHHARREAAKLLGKIDPGNKKAINALLQLLVSTTENSTPREAVELLEKKG